MVPERPTEPIPQPSATSPKPLVLELPMRLLASPLTSATIEIPVSTLLVSPSTAAPKMAMIHVGPSSSLVDPFMTFITPLQAFRPSSGTQL